MLPEAAIRIARPIVGRIAGRAAKSRRVQALGFTSEDLCQIAMEAIVRKCSSWPSGVRAEACAARDASQAIIDAMELYLHGGGQVASRTEPSDPAAFAEMHGRGYHSPSDARLTLLWLHRAEQRAAEKRISARSERGVVTHKSKAEQQAIARRKAERERRWSGMLSHACELFADGAAETRGELAVELARESGLTTSGLRIVVHELCDRISILA
jgi:hypothetical protein